MAFTEKELEELRRFDALIDASPMTYRDYIISDFIEDILFPELEKQRAESHRRYQRRAESHRRYQRRKNLAKAYAQAYQAAHREEVAAKKKAWYQANRERILASQKERRKARRETA